MTPDDIRSHIFGNAADYAGKPQAIAAAFQRMQVPADEKLVNSLATEAQDYLDIQTAKQRQALAASKRHPNRDSVGTGRTIVSDTTDSRGGSMHRMDYRRTY
jgi:hypothetical protein